MLRNFMDDVKVKCRRCNGVVKAGDLILDHGYKMMVCPNCIKERKTKEREKLTDNFNENKENIRIEKEIKPPGWDQEDEYLEKAFKAKMSQMATAEKIDEEKVRYVCKKCNYKFIYNIMKQYPQRCPFCGADVSKFKIK